MTYLHGFLLCEPSVNAAEYANGSRHTMVIGPFDVHPPKWVYRVYKAYEKGVGIQGPWEKDRFPLIQTSVTCWGTVGENYVRLCYMRGPRRTQGF